MLGNLKCPTHNLKEEFRRTRLLVAFMVYEKQFHRFATSPKNSSNCEAISDHE